MRNPYEAPATAGRSANANAQRPWLWRSFLLSATGFLAALLGLVYGAVLVGVPSQDPTPAMAREESFHLAVSSGIMAISAGLFLIGLIAFVFVLVARGISRISNR